MESNATVIQGGPRLLYYLVEGPGNSRDKIKIYWRFFLILDMETAPVNNRLLKTTVYINGSMILLMTIGILSMLIMNEYKMIGKEGKFFITFFCLVGYIFHMPLFIAGLLIKKKLPTLVIFILSVLSLAYFFFWFFFYAFLYYDTHTQQP